MTPAIWKNVNQDGKVFCIRNDGPIYRVHRLKGGINFEANEWALFNLSHETYILYMHIIIKSERTAWFLDERQIERATHLTSSKQLQAWCELQAKGYVTQGPVDVDGTIYKTNAYHVWEDPNMSAGFQVS